MFKIKIADLVVEIVNRYDFVKKQCTDYIVDNTEKTDFSVNVSDESIKCESQISNNKFSKGYLESVCIYRSIADILPRYNAFVLHAAVVCVDEYAYAFSAKSGVGKSTHIKLWRKLLGDKVSIINGDKPVIRILDNKIYAYGTPWCGKEGYNNNAFAMLKSLCFVERAEENSIVKLDNSDAVKKIMHQVFIPKSENNISKLLYLLDYTFKNIDIWKLKCNMDISAAKLSYNTMKDGKINEN